VAVSDALRTAVGLHAVRTIISVLSFEESSVEVRRKDRGVLEVHHLLIERRVGGGERVGGPVGHGFPVEIILGDEFSFLVIVVFSLHAADMHMTIRVLYNGDTDFHSRD
jgi:hypothetical protein